MKPSRTGWTDPRPASTTARVLQELANGPMTLSELESKLSVTRTTMYNCVVRLMAKPRRVHVSGWVHTGGSAARQFALGAGPDAPFRPLRTIPKPRTDMTEINCRVLVDALSRPKTADELAESCRCSASYVHKYLTILMSEKPRRVYVKEWRRPDGRGGLAKVYAAGSKRDAKRPTITAAQRFKEIKADPERRERALVLRRLADARRRTRANPQPWFAALPGAGSISSTREAA